ncbi:DEAD/DEAH box helicase [Antrihabitans spumae]|uniref:Helicase associated domain protein n=1 Tax=Antrihabitans spumae TaxID=3373370 RepID=A0ABW7JZ36_9NOCA
MTAVPTSVAVQPRTHQHEAITALCDVYASGARRAQLRMFCGTGKTLVGPWLAVALRARTIVVFEPSIALVAQTISQWRMAGHSVRALAVCSDPTSTVAAAEVGDDGIDPYDGVRDTDGVTTQAGVVAGFLDAAVMSNDELTVVVSTYHSAPVIAEAMRLVDQVHQLDLVIADEAHHLAGRTDARFEPVLNDRAIPARRRLFQTATPIVMGNLAVVDPLDDLSGASSRVRSMDTESTFGAIAYSLSAGEAIARGLLPDYRVVVTTSRQDPEHVPDRAALAALVDTVGQFGVRRILSFHNRVAGARAFAERVNELGTVDGLPVRAFAVDGSMADGDRRRILHELAADEPADTVTVVSSAQCLREGVDVPAVDAVLFADPRTSANGIIQAIGRALRAHPDKTVGTIVVPLVLDGADDDQEQLADSPYGHIWRVLRGLRAEDTRIAVDLDRARRSSGVSGGSAPEDLSWLKIVGDDPGAVLARLLERSSPLWEKYYGLLVEVAHTRGSASAVTSTAVVNGMPLGMWMVEQRSLYSKELIDPDRARRLEEVPGFRWAAADAADARTLPTLDQIVTERGSLIENSCGASIYAGRTDGLNRPLSRWVARKVCECRDGTIDPWLQEELEKRAGWTWTPLSDDDDEMFEAFRQFVAWERHADVPEDHVEEGQPIGQWLVGVRRRKLLRALPPALEALLLVSIPTDRNGDRRFPWKTPETWWQIGIDAARSYIATTGTAAGVPVGHTELVDGHHFNLYQWFSRLRHSHKKGDLTAEQIAALEQLPGWKWQLSRARVAVGATVDLGDTPHGRRGYYAGCHCTVCVEESRTYARAASRDLARRHREAWVEATDVAAHLNGLLAQETVQDRADQRITVGAIAAAACVNIGLVRGLVSGRELRCHPLHRRSLLSLTVDDVHAARSVSRTRGRRGIADRNIQVDPAPTWKRIDDLLDHGWTRSAIAAALGYSRRSVLPFTRDAVSAAHAKIVEMLVDSLDGDLAPPARTPRQAKRRLAGQRQPRHDSEAEEFATSLLSQGYRIEHTATRTGLSIAIVTAIHSTLFGTNEDVA